MKKKRIDEFGGRIVQGVNTTSDINIHSIKQQAKKFGNIVNDDGNPLYNVSEYFKYLKENIHTEIQLNEYSLDGYKEILQSEWNYPPDLASYLEEKGFEILGEGLFSIVFASKSENFVIKINKGVIDHDFVDFVNYCRSNQNIHLPKFGKLRSFDNHDTGDEFYVIIAEKLIPLSEDGKGYIGSYMSELTDKIQNGEIEDIDWDETFEDLDDMYGIELEDSDKKQIIQMCELLDKMGGKFNLNKLDLSEWNIMLRGNTYVLVDPFGSRNDHPNPEEAIWHPEIIDKMLDG